MADRLRPLVEGESVADPNAPDNVIEFYEVVVERDEDEGHSRAFSVIMSPDETTISVSAAFLKPDTGYKVEIISQETRGN